MQAFLFQGEGITDYVDGHGWEVRHDRETHIRRRCGRLLSEMSHSFYRFVVWVKTSGVVFVYDAARSVKDSFVRVEGPDRRPLE